MKSLVIIIQKVFLISLLMLISISGFSQKEYEFKLHNEYKLIQIHNVSGSFSLKNHKSNSIKIIASNFKQAPKEANDLEPVFGKKDNTGIGLEVDSGDRVVYINGASRQASPSYEILIPEEITISIKMENWNTAGGPSKNGSASNWGHTGSMLFQALNNKLEIDSKYHQVSIIGPKAPIVANTMMGNISLELGSKEKLDLVHLVTIYGQIQISMASGLSTMLSIKSLQGEIFKPKNLLLEDVTEAMGSSKMGWQYFQSKLNDGKGQIHLESTYGNIILRLDDQKNE